MTQPALGLQNNLGQFSLLVLVNAFVGAMVGLERSVLPILAEREFGVASTAAVLSFIGTFGASKALANLYAGGLGQIWGRKRVLVAGWLVGLPVPLVVAWAPAWGWIVAANVLLGVNQGLTWTMTATMKLDLAGKERRGLAVGLNEFAGYAAVAGMAWLSGYLAAVHGPRPTPFLVGEGVAVVALLLSLFAVRETISFTLLESDGLVIQRGIWQGFSFYTRSLVRLNQAGFFKNLNDAVVWGVFPLLLARQNLTLDRLGLLVAIYPATWGVLQMLTGHLSDRIGRTPLVVGGMFVQAAGLACLAAWSELSAVVAGGVLLGVGTAMVYPTLIAAVSDQVRPEERAGALGAYRFWRDAGYVFGAFALGALADVLGPRETLGIVAALTAASGIGTVSFRPR